jgi:hypothetical protein
MQPELWQDEFVAGEGYPGRDRSDWGEKVIFAHRHSGAPSISALAEIDKYFYQSRPQPTLVRRTRNPVIQIDD